MQRSTILFLCLLVIAAAVLVLVDYGGADGPPARPGGAPPVAMPVDVPVDVPVDAPTDVPTDVPTDAPLVTLAVTARERFEPPPARPELVVLPDGQRLSTRLLAGLGAGFGPAVRQPGVALAAIAFEGGELLRQVAVDPAGAVPTPVGARVVVRGRVLDAGQRPVAAAVVWFGENDAAGAPRDVRVDDDGAFECDVPLGSGVPFVVRAPGFASWWRPIEVTGQPVALTAILQPAGRLQVQLAARAVDMVSARAFVMPAGQPTTELTQWPFFRQALTDGYAIDAQGRVVIDDLPQAGQLGVVVRHALAPLGAATELTLAGADSRVVVPLRFADDQFTARIVDERGEALGGVAVWVRRAGQSLGAGGSQRLLPPHLDVRGTCFARSDATGAFTVGMPLGDDLVLTLRAADHAGRDLPFPALDGALVLPDWRGGDAALLVAPPLADRVWRVTTDLGGGLDVSCAENEVFRVALPHVGRFDVDITVSVAGQVPARLPLRDLFVTGPTEVTPPKPQ